MSPNRRLPARRIRFAALLLALALLLIGAWSRAHRVQALPDSPTVTSMPTGTPTLVPTPVATLDVAAATAPARNAAWTPVIREFDGVEMVLVPAGCFMMGTTEEQIEAALAQCNEERGDCQRKWFEDEMPAHYVCFEEPFWIDRTEVTNGQYGSAGSHSGDEFPRENVTWLEAQAFCESRGARLPTEAEWEYAARGPESLVYPWGDEFVDDNAVYKANSDNETAPVGSRPEGASWVGALDMSGNVYEYVADWYAPDYGSFVGTAFAPTGPETGDERVLRGGAWYRYSCFLRAAVRLPIPQWVGDLNDGFRCARAG
jgi:sulfatase modifying factor 1